MSGRAWVTAAVVVGGLVAAVSWFMTGRAERARDIGFDPEAAARTRLEEVRGEGIDLARGPCLGMIGSGWVADVAHEPRQPVDDEPPNQCPELRTGQATHFVELTPEGKSIRVR